MRHVLLAVVALAVVLPSCCKAKPKPDPSKTSPERTACLDRCAKARQMCLDFCGKGKGDFAVGCREGCNEEQCQDCPYP